MKRISALAILVVFSFCNFVLHKTPKHWGLPLEENLYMDKYPLKMLDYREFLYLNHQSPSGQSGVSNMIYLPDSLLVDKRYSGMVYRNPQVNDSLLVGVSQWQAEGFCKWRTKMVKETDKISIQYSLPSPDDFKKAEEWLAKNKGKKGWQNVLIGPPEWTNVPGKVWVKSPSGGKLVNATEVPQHLITFRCKAIVNP